MFGWYRLWLALLVLVFHLAKPLAVSAGAVAVYSFYVLSGYLITRVVAERYHDGVSGWGRFAFNRVLRLYPAYWAVLIFSLVLIAIAPEVTQRVNRAIQQPQTLVDWFEVITIFGLLRDDIRPVPPAWSVNIELIYYLAISIALGRTKSTTLAWFITSLVLFVGILVTNQERTLQYIYFSYIGPSVCFAAGAMVYHFAKDIPARPIDALAGVLAVTAVAYVRNLPAPNAPLALVLAMTIPAAAYATWALAALRTDNVRARRADTIAGDIAYPVFLAHWPIAALVTMVIGDGRRMNEYVLLAYSVPLTIAFSFLIYFVIERPVARVRNLVRPTPRPAAQTDGGGSPPTPAGGERLAQPAAPPPRREADG